MQFWGKMVHLRHFFEILDYFCILLPKQKIYFCEHLINSTIFYSLHKKYIIKNGSNIVKSLFSVKYWLNLVASMWRNNIRRAYFLLFLEIWNQFIDATEIIDDFFFIGKHTQTHTIRLYDFESSLAQTPKRCHKHKCRFWHVDCVKELLTLLFF